MFDHLPYSACHARGNSVEPFCSFSYEQTTVQNLVRNTWTQIKSFLVIASILRPWGAWSTRTTWKPNKMDYYNRMFHIFYEVAKMGNCCPVGPQISTPNEAMEVEKRKNRVWKSGPRSLSWKSGWKPFFIHALNLSQNNFVCVWERSI